MKNMEEWKDMEDVKNTEEEGHGGRDHSPDRGNNGGGRRVSPERGQKYHGAPPHIELSGEGLTSATIGKESVFNMSGFLDGMLIFM